MAENQTAKWTSTQAYVLSVICLLVGVAVGYLARGSASPPSGVGQVQASSAAAKGAAAQNPTPEQMRQMAESQAAPLLAQLKGDPNNADLLYKIGNAYYDAEQFPDAVKYYEQCLKINPKATDVRTEMATAYHFMRRSDRDLQIYDPLL